MEGRVILASWEEGDEVKSDFDSEGEIMRGTGHVLVGQGIRAVDMDVLRTCIRQARLDPGSRRRAKKSGSMSVFRALILMLPALGWTQRARRVFRASDMDSTDEVDDRSDQDVL